MGFRYRATITPKNEEPVSLTSDDFDRLMKRVNDFIDGVRDADRRTYTMTEFELKMEVYG